jgi:hypothetical protein
MELVYKAKPGIDFLGNKLLYTSKPCSELKEFSYIILRMVKEFL